MVGKFRAFFRQHPIELAATGIIAAVVAFIQFADYQSSRTWPQQWQCHTRIRLGHLNHGQPEIYTYGPGQKARPLPYLANIWEHLQSGDSLSKSLGATPLYVLRDSAHYRLVSQWTWNETTREFEFAGRPWRKR